MSWLAGIFGLAIGAFCAWLGISPGQLAFWVVLALALAGFRWWYVRRQS